LRVVVLGPPADLRVIMTGTAELIGESRAEMAASAMSPQLDAMVFAHSIWQFVDWVEKETFTASIW